MKVKALNSLGGKCRPGAILETAELNETLAVSDVAVDIDGKILIVPKLSLEPVDGSWPAEETSENTDASQSGGEENSGSGNGEDGGKEPE